MPRLLACLTVVVSFALGCGADEGRPKKTSSRADFFSPSADDLRNFPDPERVKFLLIIEEPDSGQRIDDEVLGQLARFKNVKLLVLGGRAVSDASIEHVVKLKKLRGIAVYECAFTDDGIQQLKQLPAVKMIGFFETPVTTEGVDRLQKALPDVVVELGEYDHWGTIFDGNGCLRARFLESCLELRETPQSDETEAKQAE